MIQSKILKKYKNISHGFFNSIGGYSKGIYKSLNCGIGSKDKKKNVQANIKKVCKKIGCSKKNLLLLNQIHSSKVIKISKMPKKRPIGDSIITNKKKIALGVLTADCAPIFIYDIHNYYIGAIHAGWKGSYKKIISKTINNFKKKGSKVKDLVVVIGPCISKKNYEVKSDFLKKFLSQNKNNKKFFTFKNRKIYFSLNEYIFNQFKINGIKNIEIIKKDTYLSKNNFFSSRHSTKKNYNDYGRNISIIMIK
tara:strand:- start:7 stop:759 length:753 start_codon:yes stop_codon:yes gene_type:complete